MTKFVPVGTYRSRVESAAGGIDVTIPARRNYFVVGVVALWLCFWLFGANQMTHTQQMLGHTPRQEVPAFFFVAWGAGALFAAFVLLWNLAGRERVLVRSDLLSIRREIFGIGWTRNYETRAAKALRVVEATGSTVFGMRQNDPFGLAGGPFAFDYGAKTIRFGAGIDVAEARYLLTKIAAARPSLAEQA